MSWALICDISETPDAVPDGGSSEKGIGLDEAQNTGEETVAAAQSGLGVAGTGVDATLEEPIVLVSSRAATVACMSSYNVRLNPTQRSE
jgi:hypothetical protein